MIKTAAILIVLVLLGNNVLYAQELNVPLPACTRSESDETVSALLESGIMEEVIAIAQRIIDAEISDYVAIAADLDFYQVKWWNEVVPSLPRCAFADEVTHVLGRYIDELLLTVATMHIASALLEDGQVMSGNLYLDISAGHNETFGDLARKMTDWAGDVLNYVGIEN
jgi:hypothetical protein